jgi:hypothetical protein
VRRTTSRAKTIGIVGLVAFMVGGVLLGTAMVASASATSGETGCVNSNCSITPSPAIGLAYASPIQVTGSDFKAGAHGAVMECNLAPGEPTIAIPNNKSLKISNFGSLPVGCSAPTRAVTVVAKNGTIFAGLGIQTSTVGPPAAGNDSNGVSGATDAAAYPCPPLEPQVAAGVSCAMVFQDSIKGGNENAFADISFTTPFSTTTTTTTTSPPTTLVACNGVPKSATGLNKTTGTTASVTVTNATCLVGGEVVTVTASGLVPKSTGSILECNADPAQPTVTFLGTAIPVSCSKVAIISTGSDGTLPAADQSFTVLESAPTFTIGPPAAGTDSTGGSAATDAAKYPCPPTPAEVTANIGCVIAVGDLGGDQVAVPISFNTAVPPPANGGQSSTTTKPVAAKPGSGSKVGANNLAFTGTGPGLWWLGLVGVLLMLLGALVLAVVEGPRRLLRFAVDHARRVDRR